MAARARLMAVAVDYENQAAVFCIDGQCKEVRTSRKATRSEAQARSAFRLHVIEREPEIIVIEDPETNQRKGRMAQSIMRALIQAAGDEGLALYRVPRKMLRRSGYLDPDRLRTRLPEAAHHLPRRRSFPEKASKRTVVVEALALAAIGYDQLERSET